MLMQFLLFAASSHAKSLFAERTAGTLDRLRMTRARGRDILLGSGAAIGVVSMIATAVVFGIGVLFFGIELRSGPLAFALVVLGQAAFIGSFALLLAGLAHSEKQLDAVATLVILALCFTSGAWVPSFMLPSFLQSIGPIMPTRWLLDGMAGATWRGLGLVHAAEHAGVLFAFAALFATIGIRRFRWS
jgi:ABC-2 type transport system permease protein